MDIASVATIYLNLFVCKRYLVPKALELSVVLCVKVRANGSRGFGSSSALAEHSFKRSTLDSFSLEILILLLYKINGDLDRARGEGFWRGGGGGGEGGG